MNGLKESLIIFRDTIMNYLSVYRQKIIERGWGSVREFCEHNAHESDLPLEAVRMLLLSVDPREDGWYDEFVALLNGKSK